MPSKVRANDSAPLSIWSFWACLHRCCQLVLHAAQQLVPVRKDGLFAAWALATVILDNMIICYTDSIARLWFGASSLSHFKMRIGAWRTSTTESQVSGVASDLLVAFYVFSGGRWQQAIAVLDALLEMKAILFESPNWSKLTHRITSVYWGGLWSVSRMRRRSMPMRRRRGSNEIACKV